MALAPKLEDFPKIRGALRFYQVFAYVTGIMLLLLCAEMIVKYGLGYELFAFSNYGVLTFVPVQTAVAPTGVDLSTGILIAHGWLCVVYLTSAFRLWSLMRWPFTKFVMIALGGVVPFLSIILERKVHREVEEELAAHPEAA